MNKKRTAIIAGVVGGALALGTGGAAFAYWSAQATGTGSASTSSDVEWTVTADAATGDALAPGVGTQSVTVHVTNAGSGVQKLSSVTGAIKNADGTAWTSGTCSAADYTLTVAPVSGEVAVGAELTTTATIAMVNRNANQDDCKNASVPLYFTAS